VPLLFFLYLYLQSADSFTNSFVFSHKCLNFSVLFVLFRNWIQATFTLSSAGSNGQNALTHVCEGKEDKLVAEFSEKKSSSEEIDLSEDFCNMFGTSRNLDEVTLFMVPMLYCRRIQHCTSLNFKLHEGTN
jgi:hypothetical protein